jgi:hypothetical protein
MSGNLRNSQGNLDFHFWLVGLGMNDLHRSPCTPWSGLKGRWCTHISVQLLIACLPLAVQESVLLYDYEVLPYVGCCPVPRPSCQRSVY